MNYNRQGKYKISIFAKGEGRDSELGRAAIRDFNLGRWIFSAAFAVARCAEWVRHQNLRSGVCRFIPASTSCVIIVSAMLFVAAAFVLMAHAAYAREISQAVKRDLASLPMYTGIYLPGVGV